MIRALFSTVLLTAETAAYACECDDPAAASEAQQEAEARRIAGQNMIIAEVERTTPLNSTGPVTYKVVRPLIGDSLREISVPMFTTRLEDGRILAVPMSSCDYWGVPGQRQVMAFVSRPTNAPDSAVRQCSVFATVAAADTLRPAGMCTQFAVQAPGMVERVQRILAGKSSQSTLPPQRLKQ